MEEGKGRKNKREKEREKEGDDAMPSRNVTNMVSAVSLYAVSWSSPISSPSRRYALSASSSCEAKTKS